MPERSRLAREVGLRYVIRHDPTTPAWAEGRVQSLYEFDGLYVRIVETINWARVLIRASALHVAEAHEGRHRIPMPDGGGEVCGSCVAAALLENDLPDVDY